MRIPPFYNITPEILDLISKIEAQRIYFTSITIPKKLTGKIQRVSLLKSSLFSARIEGNPLELADLEGKKTKTDRKKEVFNILKALHFIDALKKQKLSKDLLLKLHSEVLRDLAPHTGYFRREISAIFNQAAVAVYIPPPPSKIPKLMDRLLAYINSNEEKFPIITAFVSHLIFEKIHPFLDGNGRIGRLLIAVILKKKGWSFNFTVPFEEYLDQHKDEYYYHLDQGLKNTNDYLIFMLKAFLEEIAGIKEQVDEEIAKKNSLFLPPRQEEIFSIIRDHSIASFNMIRRRFLKVPPRTLRYDLKKLADQKLIVKIGETRGRYYKSRVRLP